MSEVEPFISFEDYEKKDIDSPYRLVLMASRRAKLIIRATKSQGKLLEMKPTSVALKEIATGVERDYKLEEARKPEEPPQVQEEE